MRVVLINPPPAGKIARHWAHYPVLGLAYLAASLRDRGHDVRIADGKLCDLSVDAIIDRTLQFRPDLIGVTAMTIDQPQAVAIAEGIRAKSTIPIATGGPHANGVGHEVLDESTAFDFACLGEGEELICELAHCLSVGTDLRQIVGLAWRDTTGAITVNEARPYPENYDLFPFPAWDLFAIDGLLPILTHRGCPFKCVFCGHNSGFMPRYRSPANVLDELSFMVEHHAPTLIRFEDETFGLNMPRAKQLLRGIIDRGLHERTHFSAQTRVDRVDEEFIDLLVQANFETLEVGVESGNQEVLTRIQKGITLSQVEHAVGLAKARDLRIWCKFILGHPGETVQSVRDTARFISRINPDRLSVALMTPYPGTPIFDMAMKGEGGYRLLSHSWTDFDKFAAGALELEGLSLGQLRRYQIWCYIRLYVTNGRVMDLLRLVWSQRNVTLRVLTATIRRTLSELTGAHPAVKSAEPSAHAS